MDSHIGMYWENCWGFLPQNSIGSWNVYYCFGLFAAASSIARCWLTHLGPTSLSHPSETKYMPRFQMLTTRHTTTHSRPATSWGYWVSTPPWFTNKSSMAVTLSSFSFQFGQTGPIVYTNTQMKPNIIS